VRESLESSHDQNDSVQDAILERTLPREKPLETQESKIYKSESVRESLESSYAQDDSVQDAILERTPPREKPLET
jgi:hypothetical protein